MTAETLDEFRYRRVSAAQVAAWPASLFGRHSRPYPGVARSNKLQHHARRAQSPQSGYRQECTAHSLELGKRDTGTSLPAEGPKESGIPLGQLT